MLLPGFPSRIYMSIIWFTTSRKENCVEGRLKRNEPFQMCFERLCGMDSPASGMIKMSLVSFQIISV